MSSEKRCNIYYTPTLYPLPIASAPVPVFQESLTRRSRCVSLFPARYSDIPASYTQRIATSPYSPKVSSATRLLVLSNRRSLGAKCGVRRDRRLPGPRSLRLPRCRTTNAASAARGPPPCAVGVGLLVCPKPVGQGRRVTSLCRSGRWRGAHC